MSKEELKTAAASILRRTKKKAFSKGRPISQATVDPAMHLFPMRGVDTEN